MRNIWPCIVPWPSVRIVPNRARISLTTLVDPIPAGPLIEVTAFAGELTAKGARPSATAASRVASASSAALAIRFLAAQLLDVIQRRVQRHYQRGGRRDNSILHW